MALSPEVLKSVRLHRVEISTGSFGPGSEVIKIDGRRLNGVTDVRLELGVDRLPVVTLTMHALEAATHIEAELEIERRENHAGTEGHGDGATAS